MEHSQDDPDGLMHVVGYIQLGLTYIGKTPRALCGVSTTGIAEGAPGCPRCVELTSWTEDERSRFLRGEEPRPVSSSRAS